MFLSCVFSSTLEILLILEFNFLCALSMIGLTAPLELVSHKMMKINVKFHSGSFQRRTTTSLGKTNGRLTFDKLLKIFNLAWNRIKKIFKQFLRFVG